MKVLRFKNDQPEWTTPLTQLKPALKQALRLLRHPLIFRHNQTQLKRFAVEEGVLQIVV